MRQSSSPLAVALSQAQQPHWLPIPLTYCVPLSLPRVSPRSVTCLISRQRSAVRLSTRTHLFWKEGLHPLLGTAISTYWDFLHGGSRNSELGRSQFGRHIRASLCSSTVYRACSCSTHFRAESMHKVLFCGDVLHTFSVLSTLA